MYRWKVGKYGRESADAWLQSFVINVFFEPIKQYVSDDGWYLLSAGKQSVV